MRKRRFLALFLALTLIAAASPIIADSIAVLTGTVTDDTVSTEWAGADGEALPAVNADGEFMQFEQADGAKYQFHYKAGSTLAAGDYTLSVTMRFDPEEYAEKDYANYINGTKASNTRGCLVDNGIVVGINAGTHASPANNILTASADNTTLKVNSFLMDGVTAENGYALALDDEWHNFEIGFTLNEEQTLTHFGAVVFFMNIRSDFTIPVQVKALSLVNETTEEAYSQGMDAKYWGYRLNTSSGGYSYAATVSEIVPHFTTIGTGVTSIKYIGSDTEAYAAGGYTVKATVRGEIGTNLTADIKGKTASASLATDTWETVEFTLDNVPAFTMQDVTLAFDAEIDIKTIKLVNVYYTPVNDDWAGTNGASLNHRNTDESAVQFESSSTDAPKYQFHYKAGSTLAAGDYTLSVTMRFDPDAYARNDYASYVGEIGTRGCVVDGGVVVALNSGSHNTRLLRTDNPDTLITTTSFLKDGKTAPSTETTGYATALSLDDEWHTFEIKFTLNEAQTLTNYGAVVFFYNIRSGFTIPVQVKDFSLVNETSGEAYSKGMDTKYWGSRTIDSYKYAANVSEIFPYYTTSGTDITAITYVGSDTTEYAAGGYNVKAKIRGAAGTVVTVNVENSSASYTLTSSTWEDIELPVNITDAFTMSDVTLTYTSDIDFTEIELINTYIYSSDWNANGLPAAAVDETSSGAPTSEYIHVYDRVSTLDLVQYRNDGVNLTAGETYTATVYMREGGIIEDRAADTTAVQIFYSATTTDRLITSDLVTDTLDGDFDNTLDAALVGETWKKYTMTFTPVNDQTGLKVIFKIIGNADFATTLDIDGLSLVSSDGTQLISDGEWETVSFNSDTGIKLSHIGKSEYNRTVNETQDNTVLTYINTEHSAGTYTVSGRFRIAARSTALVDYTLKKYRPDLYLSLVSGDDNTAILGVKAGDKVYASVAITDEWSEVMFTFTAESDFDTLSIVSNTAYDIDFENLTVTKAE
ncbi:MAG: hypothetical protein IJY93_03585 [Clostridia bacterium]|nr:hypothetical protein [Clostridia bacterium]